MKFISAEKNRWQLFGDLICDDANTVLQESESIQIEGTQLTIDFSAVSDIDTASIALMLAWKRRAKVEFCEIEFVNVPESLKSLAVLYGVEDFIHLH
jgi:phospholipid transport system transporter-binding protein